MGIRNRPIVAAVLSVESEQAIHSSPTAFGPRSCSSPALTISDAHQRKPSRWLRVCVERVG